MLLPQESGITIQNEIQFQKEEAHITVGRANGIFSWYDPFQNYTLTNTENTYRITQITNGSVYVGTEDDGTISLYSIDLVADLTFLAGGEDMTKIIIFPGMYLRFDPSLNLGLRDADLFRIMLALKNTDSDANTGIEFVDPRIRSTGSDIFFMYRLPRTVHPLFELLHLSFLERAQSINLLEQYGRSQGYAFSIPEGNSIHNPTKNEYYLLRELEMLFANVVVNETNVEDFHTSITSIQRRAKQLSAENTVQKLIEQFLIDGRFALFLDNKNSQIQEIYNEIAHLVHITPTTGKGRLFQALSNIFSKNLLQDTKEQVNQIDNYILAVNELKNTLTNTEMETKDYFDISLYAYLMFEKMTDGKIIDSKALESETLYQLYIAIFQATQNYTNGIGDLELKNTAQKSITLRFYEPMMDMLVHSLYATYATENNGNIFIKDEWLLRDGTKFTNSFYGNVSSVLERITVIFQSRITSLYQGNETQVRDSLEEKIAQLDGFVKMISPGAYRSYRGDPYVAGNKEYPVPKFNTNTKKIVVESDAQITATNIPNTQNTIVNTSAEETIRMAQVLKQLLSLPELTHEHIQITSQGYLVNIQKDSIQYRFEYLPDTMSVENIVLSAANLPPIRIADALPLGNFRSFMATSKDNIDRLYAIYRQNPGISAPLITISIPKNHIQIGNQSFRLYE